MSSSSPGSSGIACSLAASVLFAANYYVATWLSPLGGLGIYGWRVLLTVPLVGLFIVASGRQRDITQVWQRTRQYPWLWAALLLSSALLGVQLWLFLWAPINGHALAVSLGYFLLPLTLVLTGRWVFGERISRWQSLACLVALLGVANEVILTQHLAWPTLVVALGCPCYFALRRKLRTNHLGGMWFDMVLSLPVALVFIHLSWPDLTHAQAPGQTALAIAAIALLSALALVLLVMASDRLPMPLFGLLGYVEPALLVVVAVLIGERIAANQWPTYLAIWAAVALLAAEGWQQWRRSQRQRLASSP